MVTQKDIARRVGVSPSLVSHVLGGRGRQIHASVRTIGRIEREAARQGYAPSAAALVLRGRAARMIGVVARHFDDPYLGHLVGEVHRLARQAGYALLVTGCESGPNPQPVLDSLRRYPMEGILLAGSDMAGHWFDSFSRQGIRGVQIGTGAPLPGMRQVCVDEAAGMGAVTRHLLSLGHRRLAFAGCQQGAHVRRHAAVVAALRQAGLRPAASSTAAVGDLGALERVLQAGGGSLRSGATAIVCADDEVAQVILHAAHTQGVRVPEELSVTGMDDIPAARLMPPGLTTLRQPLESMISAAFSLLTGATGDATAGESPIVFEPTLIVRGTTAPPCARSASRSSEHAAASAERNT